MHVHVQKCLQSKIENINAPFVNMAAPDRATPDCSHVYAESKP